MANITFNNITKTFGDDVIAVEDLEMEIPDGEFLVIVGPSGCGKTTTLRMVAGLEDVTDGDLKIGDTVVNDKRPQERDLAMVFQSYALYPHMTVKRNIGFGLEQTTDLSDDEISRKVEEIGDRLDIKELLDRKPGELSGGQQQRVALGRAIVRDPEVFLMDEPLSNLDAKLRSEMRTELQRLQEQLEVTTIYVTHDQTEAMTMGDRVAILNEGRLQQLGTPLECYHEPTNRFVAGFIGEPSMNFIKLTRKEDTLIRDDFVYHLNEEMTKKLNPTTNVSIGIRPEDIEVLKEPNGSNDFRATIDVVEPFGKEHNYYLWPDEGAFDNPLVATVNGRQQFEQDNRVGIRLATDNVHLFDAETEDALRHPPLEDDETVTSLPE